MLIQVSSTFLEGVRARSVSETICFTLDPTEPPLLDTSQPAENARPLLAPGQPGFPRGSQIKQRLPPRQTEARMLRSSLEISRLPGISGIFIAVCFNRYIEDGQYLFNDELNCLLWGSPLTHVGTMPCCQEGKTCISVVCH